MLPAISSHNDPARLTPLLCRQARTAALTPALNNLATALGRHSGTKTMAPFADQPAGLKSTFHNKSPYFYRACTAPKFLSNFKGLINTRAMRYQRLGVSTAKLPGLYGDNAQKSTRSVAHSAGKTAHIGGCIAHTHRL